MPVLAGLLDRDAHRIDAAHLPGADAKRLAAAGDHDRVRKRVLDDGPGEQQIVPLGRGDLTTHDLHRVQRIGAGVALLHEEAAKDALGVPFGRLESSSLEIVEHADPWFLGESFDGNVVEPGCEQHFDEMLGESRPERRADGSIDNDDTAVRRDRVGGERPLVCLFDRVGDSDPARIRVLHDHARRTVELETQKACGGEVVEVVERERLAVELLDPG